MPFEKSFRALFILPSRELGREAHLGAFVNDRRLTSTSSDHTRELCLPTFARSLVTRCREPARTMVEASFMSLIRKHWSKISGGLLIVTALGVGAMKLYNDRGGECCQAGASCCHPGASCCSGRHKLAER